MTSKGLELGGKRRIPHGLRPDESCFSMIPNESHWELVALCRKFLPEAACCWDLGEYRRYVASAFGPVRARTHRRGRARHHGYNALVKNFTENGLPDIVVPMHVAVGDHDGGVSFIDASAYGHIGRDRPPTTTLILPTSLFIAYPMPRLDFVKSISRVSNIRS
jgi:hypothetical protein